MNSLLPPPKKMVDGTCPESPANEMSHLWSRYKDDLTAIQKMHSEFHQKKCHIVDTSTRKQMEKLV